MGRDEKCTSWHVGCTLGLLGAALTSIAIVAFAGQPALIVGALIAVCFAALGLAATVALFAVLAALALLTGMCLLGRYLVYHLMSLRPRRCGRTWRPVDSDGDRGGLEQPMPFWGTQILRARLQEIVPQGNPDRVQEGKYELSMGAEAYLSGSRRKTELRPGGIVVVEPGQIALLITEETVCIPDNAIGFISLKSSAKLAGLVNVSGFYVDPGFKGKLIFTVYNAGTTAQPYHRGQPLFQLWVADLAGEPDVYRGRKQNQSTIPAEMIAPLTASGVSPAALERRIAKLEVHAKVGIGLLIALLAGVVIALFQDFPFRAIGPWIARGLGIVESADSQP